MALTWETLMVALEETNHWLYKLLFETFDEQELADVLKATDELMVDGGEKIADSSRYRTKAGVFLRLLRDTHPDRMKGVLAKQQAKRQASRAERVQEAAGALDSHTDVQKGLAVCKVWCPPELTSRFVGKAGKVINELREATGLTIKVDENTPGEVKLKCPEAEAAEKMDAGRATVLAKIGELILHSHTKYGDLLMLCDFMMIGHSGELTEEWEIALYMWCITAVQRTPAVHLRSCLQQMAAQAAPEVRALIAEKLEAEPRMLGPDPCQVVVDAILLAAKSEALPEAEALPADEEVEKLVDCLQEVEVA